MSEKEEFKRQLLKIERLLKLIVTGSKKNKKIIDANIEVVNINFKNMKNSMDGFYEVLDKFCANLSKVQVFIFLKAVEDCIAQGKELNLEDRANLAKRLGVDPDVFGTIH